MNLYSAFFCKKNPKRAACASLVEREEKGFDVAPSKANWTFELAEHVDMLVTMHCDPDLLQ